MIYYYIQLTENVSNFCIMIILWRKYHYKDQTMGVNNSLDIFQQKMNDLFQVFGFICL